MKRTKFNFLAVASLFTALAFTACDSNEDMNNPDEPSKGTANISATDATVAAENITGVYLSVKGILVDATDDQNDAELMFDTNQEFNLMAYQNGDTYGLGSIELNEGSYSDITLILDEDTPAYVKFDDNTTSEIEIEGGNNHYEIFGDFDIQADAQTDLVADIDLRKAFKETSQEGHFMLRKTGRLVRASVAGSISGTIDNYQEMKTEKMAEGKDAKVVVFAYAAGTFSESEREDVDGSGVAGRFENAVNSTVVADDGTFTLAFMEEADYDIVVGVFEKEESAPDDESYMFDSLIESKLSASGSLGLILDGLGVSANSNTNIMINLGLGS